MIKYIFKEPVTIKGAKNADAQKIGEALAAVEAKNGDRLTPSVVVEVAQSKRSPLHPHFEWDDAEAAKAHREDQARSLIRSIRAVTDDGQESPAYLSVHDAGGTSYRSAGTVKRSLELQMAVQKAAARDLRAWEHRYKELTDICDMVSQAREKLAEQIDQAA